MTTQALDHNVIGFRSGMHRRYSGYDRTERDHSLAAREMLALPDRNLTLVCLAGELWVTRDGDIEDYILDPGQHLAIRRGDQAAVQALQPSRVRVVAA
ncbi:MAG: DUF2917 domain-containing protein [Rhodocyclales bacterium]|nr:DUF2917 domain-containing protein [Rhodocyclales bacterium]